MAQSVCPPLAANMSAVAPSPSRGLFGLRLRRLAPGRCSSASTHVRWPCPAALSSAAPGPAAPVWACALTPPVSRSPSSTSRHSSHNLLDAVDENDNTNDLRTQRKLKIYILIWCLASEQHRVPLSVISSWVRFKICNLFVNSARFTSTCYRPLSCTNVHQWVPKIRRGPKVRQQWGQCESPILEHCRRAGIFLENHSRSIQCLSYSPVFRRK